MAFDIDMIKKVYEIYPERIAKAREITGKPLSLAEKIILSSCDNEKDTFLKNEYIIDFEKSIMTRNFIYNNKTYKKLKLTDLSVKKAIEQFNQDNSENFTIKKFIRFKVGEGLEHKKDDFANEVASLTK